jgi:predicted nucleotidyltransferase component of viral defense system
MSRPAKDLSASVLARLLNHSREKKEDYQSLLFRYVAERFLYRLGQSEYRDSFILKGAYLLSLTFERQTYRTTRDIDFLKTGTAEKTELEKALRAICAISFPEDAVRFDTDSIHLQAIRERNAYQGQRAKIAVYIGKARVTLQIDIGIGDSVYPSPVFRTIPSLLDLSGPEVSSYPIETVISEKLEAIVAISMLTSRMKDFYDLYVIISAKELDYIHVKTALTTTFFRRGTKYPEDLPTVFSDQVFEDTTKKKQWKAFTNKLRNEHSDLDFQKVIRRLQEFSAPLWGKLDISIARWIPGQGWIEGERK